MANSRGSVVSAMFWMFLISILLFWLPVIGPFLAGYVGGKKAGSVESALLAVFLPAILVGGLIFAFSALLLGLPLIGFLFALGGVAASMIHVGPLLLGAIIGGATA